MRLRIGVVGFLGLLFISLSLSYEIYASRQIYLRDMHYIHQIKSDGTPLHAGEIVKVRGIVVVPPGIFTKTIYIYDPATSRGVQVYGVTLTSVKIGDLVEVTGEITHYNGETEIKINSASDVTVLESNRNFKPERIYTDNAYNEIYEGSFVEVCGKVVSTNLASGYFYLNDSSGNIMIYAPHLNINWITVGMQLSVVGVVGQYDRTSPYFSYYQIKPRFQGDIKNISTLKAWCGRNIYVPSSNQSVKIYTNISALEIYLNYTTNNWSTYNRVLMLFNSSSGYYEATINGAPAGTLVRYCVEIKDVTSRWNSSIEYKYFVDNVKIETVRIAPSYTAVNIIGNVTVKPNTFSPKNMFIQNGSYGIEVVSDNLPSANYTDSVEVKGYLVRMFYNDVYVVGKDVRKFREGSPVSPIPISIENALKNNYGALVAVSGTIVSVDSNGFNISNGIYTLRIYNASSSQIPWLAVGKRVVVRGVQAQRFENQVWIRSADDVEEVLAENLLFPMLPLFLILLIVMAYEKKQSHLYR